MASLEEQLKAVKLKKSAKPIKDFSSPKTAGFMKEQDIKDYEKAVLEVNTETWVDILKDETFPTVLCPFLYEEAKIFLAIYERLYLNKDSQVMAETDWRQSLSDEEKLCLNQLKTRLQASMDIYTKEGDAFVKTSSRSAKDAPLVQEKFKQLYKKELDNFDGAKITENVQITCLLKAAFLALKVKTADDVLDMFLRSERIYQDLLLAAINQKDKYNENFVIRKFFDIDVDMEFRGFIHDYELVALSQYNYAIYSERLVKYKEHYRDLVKKYYDENIKPKLQEANYPKHSIVDFAICKEGNLLYGHVERSSGAIKCALDIQVDGRRGPGCPSMSWKELTKKDCKEWKLSGVDPHDRVAWRSGVRIAMCAASQLPGKGPTTVDLAPEPAR